MRRETANLLLVLLGGALLKIARNGTYLRYVKPSLLPFLVVTGVVITALEGLAITRDIRRGHPTDTGHEHGGRSPWLLALPVLAIFLVAPAALGADKVNRSAQTVGAQDRSAADFDALPAGGVAELPMGEFVTRAAWDSSGLDGGGCGCAARGAVAGQLAAGGGGAGARLGDPGQPVRACAGRLRGAAGARTRAVLRVLTRVAMGTGQLQEPRAGSGRGGRASAYGDI